ncbi:hypothetical protein B0H13DRAFT_2565759 [Mycena leptocephala]|nr:hypothetical protein B0H13DRAFT_2565759 [Mycena leptocephala]
MSYSIALIVFYAPLGSQSLEPERSGVKKRMLTPGSRPHLRYAPGSAGGLREATDSGMADVQRVCLGNAKWGRISTRNGGPSWVRHRSPAGGTGGEGGIGGALGGTRTPKRAGENMYRGTQGAYAALQAVLDLEGQREGAGTARHRGVRSGSSNTKYRSKVEGGSKRRAGQEKRVVARRGASQRRQKGQDPQCVCDVQLGVAASILAARELQSGRKRGECRVRKVRSSGAQRAGSGEKGGDDVCDVRRGSDKSIRAAGGAAEQKQAAGCQAGKARRGGRTVGQRRPKGGDSVKHIHHEIYAGSVDAGGLYGPRRWRLVRVLLRGHRKQLPYRARREGTATKWAGAGGSERVHARKQLIKR